MPAGDLTSQVQSTTFPIMHVVLLLVGGYFAWRAVGAHSNTLAWGFALLGLAQVAHLTYHMNASNFFLGHLAAESLELIGVILVGAATVMAVGAEGTRRRPV